MHNKSILDLHGKRYGKLKDKDEIKSRTETPHS